MKVAFSLKRFFDNRELRRPPAFDIEDWYQTPTVGYIGGWLAHAHWNERFLKSDVFPDSTLPVATLRRTAPTSFTVAGPSSASAARPCPRPDRSSS